MAQSLSAAYGRIGNVTYVGTGNGENGGVTSRVAQEVAGMVPLLGAVFESTTGLRLRDLIAGSGGQGAGATDEATDGAAVGHNGVTPSTPSTPAKEAHVAPVIDAAVVPVSATTSSADEGAPRLRR